MFRLASFFFAWLAAAGLAKADEPMAKKSDLPRVAPTEAENSLSAFSIREGFAIQLVAAEPLVTDPVAMAFDEHGRLYVVEMVGYSEHREDRLGRVRLLEDNDGDGVFDRATIFADNLAWPTAVACYDGGVFVGATPDILYLKDTDGDRKSDVRRVALTGFGEGVKRLNMQSLMNSFRWGLDNRIHGSASGTPGKVRVPSRPELETVSFARSDFSFDPRTLEFRLESGGAQHGMDFDAVGRKFVCSNSRHIQQVMHEQRYVGINPFFIPTSPLHGIAVDGAAAPVFRRSPDEAWRVIRTRWRVNGKVGGPVEGGGRPSGYFTAATGITIYDGHAWPSEFRGDAFIADCGSNLIHRKKLQPAGVSFMARRPDDERDREFLASTDNWFRPVQMEVGPDGALYIADMYREVIEHPWSLPRGIKQHIDLDSGNDRGRIYRIIPDIFVQPTLPALGQATETELVAALDHPNGWHRSTASRLLFERQNRAVVAPLRRLAKRGKTDLGRMHALHVLAGLDALEDDDVAAAMVDFSPIVRGHSVRLAEQFLPTRKAGLAGQLSEDHLLVRNLVRLSATRDFFVQNQLAWTLGLVDFAGKTDVLHSIFRQAGADYWQLPSLFNATTERHGRLIDAIEGDEAMKTNPYREMILRNLGTMKEGRLAQFVAPKKRSASVQPIFKPSGIVNPDRAKVVEQFRPSLAKRGKAGLGRKIFEQRCGACHQLGGVGQAIGPDLRASRSNGAEQLLIHLIDPNREVAAQYVLHEVRTANGQEPVIGSIRFMNDAVIQVGLPDGSERQLLRSEGDEVKSIGRSLMPEGLEAGLSVGQMADLLAWLLEAE